MKKKLLVFHPFIQNYRVDLFNELNSRFNTRICVFMMNGKSQTFNYSKISSQFEFTPILLEKNGTLKWCHKLIQQIREFKPQIVLTSEFGLSTLLTIIYKLLTFKKYRIISIVDDSYDMLVNGNQFTQRHKLATQLLTPLINNIVTVEPRVKEYFQHRYKKGIFMPIIADEIKVRKRLERVLPISEQYIKQYNLEGKHVLLFVGRLVNLKNIDFAIQAFMDANVPDSVFVIVGSGDEEEKLRELALGHENVKFVGRLEGDELYAWYNIAQTFTLPSIQEAFGAVTNEALLGGCYVLVSKLAGSNCLIKEGINGNLINPYDRESFSYILKVKLLAGGTVCVPLKVRENKMQIHFSDCINNLCEKISDPS